MNTNGLPRLATHRVASAAGVKGGCGAPEGRRRGGCHRLLQAPNLALAQRVLLWLLE